MLRPLILSLSKDLSLSKYERASLQTSGRFSFRSPRPSHGATAIKQTTVEGKP
jgi:hypothetical protein